MPQSKVDTLTECVPGLGFIDITDYPKGFPRYTGPIAAIPARPTHQATVNPLLTRVSGDQIFGTITSLSQFPTRYYTSTTGRDAANFLIDRYRSYGNGVPGTSVEAFTHSWIQPSVIASIAGSSAPNEIVIIGGHIYSTSNGATAPGADDDASGSACVLEVFRVLTAAGFRPERTLEFHGYAAEEVGLRGSAAIASSYANAGYNVVAMLQLDMTGFIRSGTTPTVGIVTDYTTPALSAFVRLLVTEYLNIGWTNTACNYGCSDHASWYNAGYTDAFTFESTFPNSNPNIHTTRDTIDLLDQDHATEFAKLGLAFAVELSYEE